MAIQERQRLNKVDKKILQNAEGEEVTVYEALYCVEDYDDEITPIEAVPAVTEMRQQMTEACEGLYDADGNCVHPECEAEPVFTKGEPALYSANGDLIIDAVEPEPVMEEVIVEPAIEAVTDIVEFKRYHRKVFTLDVDDIPQDVLDMGDAS